MMSRRSTVLRRIRTIPLFVVGFLLALLASPVLLACSLTVDLGRWILRRRPWMAWRLTTFLILYLGAETVGLAVLFLDWVASRRGSLTEGAYRIQQAWAAFLFGTVRSLFRLRLTVEEDTAVVPGPILLFARHTSMVDNLLPACLVSRTHGLRLRYVLKEELLSDPALDVAGNRLRNHFVRRGSNDTERETAALRHLATDLTSDEGVLIYPEGTRYTEEKRIRAVAALADRNPEAHASAARLRHVLPPRLGGPLALLEGSDADVVVMAHRGLDGFAGITDIWRGGLLGTDVSVRFWRIPRVDIPEGREARADWLLGVWHQLDEWVASGTAPLAS